MSANNITQLCQQAAKAYLDSEDLSFKSQIVLGIAADEIQLPLVVCQCQQAQANVPYEGNWSASLRIELRSNCDSTTQDQHHANAGELFGKFMVSIAAGKTAMTSQTLGFTCQQLLPVRQGWEIYDSSWVSYLELTVECCGSYIPDS